MVNMRMYSTTCAAASRFCLMRFYLLPEEVQRPSL
jgi:hypothetical protein